MKEKLEYRFLRYKLNLLLFLCNPLVQLIVCWVFYTLLFNLFLSVETAYCMDNKPENALQMMERDFRAKPLSSTERIQCGVYSTWNNDKFAISQQRITPFYTYEYLSGPSPLNKDVMIYMFDKGDPNRDNSFHPLTVAAEPLDPQNPRLTYVHVTYTSALAENAWLKPGALSNSHVDRPYPFINPAVIKTINQQYIHIPHKNSPFYDTSLIELPPRYFTGAILTEAKQSVPLSQEPAQLQSAKSLPVTPLDKIQIPFRDPDFGTSGITPVHHDTARLATDFNKFVHYLKRDVPVPHRLPQLMLFMESEYPNGILAETRDDLTNLNSGYNRFLAELEAIGSEESDYLSVAVQVHAYFALEFNYACSKNFVIHCNNLAAVDLKARLFFLHLAGKR